MRFILICLCMLVSGCSNYLPPKHVPTVAAKRSVRARVTYYAGPQRVASGGRAVQGRTIAAHPKYRFGTKVVIPELYQYLGDKEFTVLDRGSAVTSAKAAHGRADVFDIFVKNESTMRRLEKFAPEYMEVEL